jgi:hypothetical protein
MPAVVSHLQFRALIALSVTRKSEMIRQPLIRPMVGRYVPILEERATGRVSGCE